jgi:mRNA interferase MazF
MPKKGTVVLVPFPFTDLSGSKVRPAVVVSVLRGTDVVVAFVTSNVGRLSPTDVPIRRKDAAFARTGLKHDSVLRAGKLATLERSVLLGELGQLSKQHVTALDACLVAVFGLHRS